MRSCTTCHSRGRTLALGLWSRAKSQSSRQTAWPTSVVSSVPSRPPVPPLHHAAWSPYHCAGLKWCSLRACQVCVCVGGYAQTLWCLTPRACCSPPYSPLPSPNAHTHTHTSCPSPDKIGLHRISNQSHTIRAVSLHLYSPPYEECRSFCELSGAARASGKMTFYSKGGVKLPALER
jgi:hypothetical protein